MAGGTFTISNGGVFGSLMGTPIINLPQTAILGMHSIKERPIAVNGKVRIESEWEMIDVYETNTVFMVYRLRSVPWCMLLLPMITDSLMVVRLLHSWLELRNSSKILEDFFWVFKLSFYTYENKPLTIKTLPIWFSFCILPLFLMNKTNNNIYMCILDLSLLNVRFCSGLHVWFLNKSHLYYCLLKHVDTPKCM